MIYTIDRMVSADGVWCRFYLAYAELDCDGYYVECVVWTVT